MPSFEVPNECKILSKKSVKFFCLLWQAYARCGYEAVINRPMTAIG